jgi:hypothetical protein
MATDSGLDFLDSETGRVRFAYAWEYQGYRACQPQVYEDDSIIIPTGLGAGTRRIRVVDDGETFTAQELWTSLRLKPDFNDFVIHQGHAYGFDNTIFASIDLETGQRNWKGGRYGKGQVLLVSGCDKLLVTAESGEVVLLEATPESHQELGRFSALEGKTWTHPVLVEDRLYLRNAQEAACYRLPVAVGPSGEDATVNQ